MTDAIVVGAGIVGAACAYYLAQEGLSVTVLDAEFAGGGTTAAGMGHVVVFDDDPLAAYSQNLLWALDPPDIGLDRCGTIWVAETPEQLSMTGGEVLDERALREAEPSLRPGLAGGLLVRSDGVVYQPALTRWLLSGLTVNEHTRVGRLDQLKADVIVNATGPWAPTLTPGLPIIPRKGHLVVTDRVPGLFRHQVAELGYVQSAKTLGEASVAFNVQPRSTGQILIGSSRELVGWDASINRDVLSRMVRRATEFMPALADVTALRVWTGFRPATPDHRPCIGAWPETPRVWIAAGHEGLGITMALGTGRLLADLILRRTPAIDPAPYLPSRIVA